MTERGTWQYWRPPLETTIEVGMVRGFDVALPTHYHEEDQTTFVLSGRRRFVVGNQTIEVFPGQSVRIPAGTPHRSLAESTEVLCINVYTLPDASVPGVRSPGIYLSRGETVTEAAQRSRMSREGFSRRFKKNAGVAPQQYRLLENLNDARRLLRAGQPIAAVAAEAGFADQSHLGRCFRRFFGVTPHRYRAGQIAAEVTSVL